MVESKIKNLESYPTKTQLWRNLPKKVMFQTLGLILKYLQESNKIYITKEGLIMWISADTEKRRKLLEESVPHV
ncbi:MAG: hypothetical protein J4428_01665 [Candidatus Aenigmarchaeota archaeon]|nr:hypothetical protein [Candidatus Aenigmarchaeota archaeon]